MYSLDPVESYNQRVRQILAQREQASAQAEASKNQIAGGLGQIGGVYLGKKGGAAILSALSGGSGAAPVVGIPSGITGLTALDTTVPAIGPLASPLATAAPATSTAAASAPFLGIGVAPAAAIAGATYLGGKSLLDLIQGNEDNSLSGKAGRATLGIATGGLSEIARHFLGDQDKWKTEARRLKELQSQGVSVPQSLIDSMPTSGRSDSELMNNNYAADFIGRGKLKEWINNKFAASRNESDLKPEDVVNYGAFAEKFGKNYFDVPLATRLQAAQITLDAGAVNEHHGTVDFNDQMNAALQSKIGSILNPSASSTNSAPVNAGLGLAGLLNKSNDVKINFK